MKKATALLFLSALILLVRPVSASTQRYTCLPSPQKVLLDGQEVAISAYSIEGSNYFKVRDLAALFTGSGAQFSVEWLPDAQVISLVTGGGYMFGEGDLSFSDGKSKWGIISPQVVFVNAEEVKLEAFLIEGNNYFKLRDLAKYLRFSVEYDAEKNAVLLSTLQPPLGYEPPMVTTEGFPKEGILIGKLLEKIAFSGQDLGALSVSYQAKDQLLQLIDGKGTVFEIGTVEVYCRQNGQLRSLTADERGLISQKSFLAQGLRAESEFVVLLMLKTIKEEKFPLLTLSNKELN